MDHLEKYKLIINFVVDEDNKTKKLIILTINSLSRLDDYTISPQVFKCTYTLYHMVIWI